jgi:hypothetical protein
VFQRARIGLPPFSAGQSNPSQRRVSTEDCRRRLTTKDTKITKEEFSRKGAKAAKGKRFLRGGRSLLRVMLKEVKHLLCAFRNSYDQDRKVKSRFFVAEFILSMAEGLLRMTHEGKGFVGCAPRTSS